MSHTSHANMVHWHCVLATEVLPSDAFLCMLTGFHSLAVWSKTMYHGVNVPENALAECRLRSPESDPQVLERGKRGLGVEPMYTAEGLSPVRHTYIMLDRNYTLEGPLQLHNHSDSYFTAPVMPPSMLR